MIFLFQGDRSRGRSARTCMALVAAVERFKTEKKVLMMSFKNNMPGNNLEDFLEENVMEDSSGNQIAFMGEATYTDDGIDAAIRRAESGILKKEQLSNCITPLLKMDFCLDILHTTKESAFETTLMRKWSSIEKIIKIADSMYDYVFIYAPVEDEAFIDKLNEIATKIVFVVRQGKKQKEPECNEKVHNKTSILVSDYEAESSWNIKYMKKVYNTNNIFLFPHNVMFGDIKEHGKIVDFAARNISITQSDYNFELVKEIKALTNFLDGTEKEADHRMAQDIDYEPLEKTERTPVLTEHSTSVSREEQMSNGGLFKKKSSFFVNIFQKKDTPSPKAVYEPEPVSESKSRPEPENNIEGMVPDDSKMATEDNLEQVFKDYPDPYEQEDTELEEVGTEEAEQPEIVADTEDDFDDGFEYEDSHQEENEPELEEVTSDVDDTDDDFEYEGSKQKAEPEIEKVTSKPQTDDTNNTDSDFDTDWMNDFNIEDDEIEETMSFSINAMFSIGTEPRK